MSANRVLDADERIHDQYINELRTLNEAIDKIPLDPKWKTWGIVVGIIVFLIILLIAIFIGKMSVFIAAVPIAIILGVVAGLITYSVTFSNGQPELAKMHAQKNHLLQQMNPNYNPMVGNYGRVNYYQNQFRPRFEPVSGISIQL